MNTSNVYVSMDTEEKVFTRGEVVQFNPSHSWGGCLGIVDEVEGSRIRVGVTTPSSTAFICVENKDLYRLILKDGHEAYGFSNRINVVSPFIPFDPDEDGDED